MADFSALKTSIQNYIKQNGNEEITGNLLQQILLSMVSTLGDSAINDLVAALNTEIANRGNADTTLQGNINSEATTRANADTELGGRITTLQGVVNGIKANVENGYVYAGIATPSTTPASGKVFYLALTAGTYTNFGATVVPQGINILKYNGSAWSLDSFLGLDDAPTQGSSNLVKSGGVLDSIIKDGSAFDLSAYNNGTTYADLSAALTALNALPAAYKKGGMSFKYVQSSDNKYVQYFLTKDEWSASESDWERTTFKKEVIQLGQNLINRILLDSGIFQSRIQVGDVIARKHISSNGELVDSSDRFSVIRIPVSEGDVCYVNARAMYAPLGLIALYNDSDLVYCYSTQSAVSSRQMYLLIPADVNYVYIQQDESNYEQYKITETKDFANTLLNPAESILSVVAPYIGYTEKETNKNTISSSFLNGEGDIVNGSAIYSIYELTVSEGEIYKISSSLYANKAAYALYNGNVKVSFKKCETSSFSGFVYIPGGVNKLYIQRTDGIGEAKKITFAAPYIIEKEKITPIELTYQNGYIDGDGNIQEHSTFRVGSASVIPGVKYNILSYGYNGNCKYVFKDENNNVLLKAQIPQSYVVYVDDVVAPSGAAVVYIEGYDSTYPKLKEYSSYTCYTGEYHPYNSKKWSAIGDSLTSGVATDKTYCEYVCERLGFILNNMGYPGTGYMRGKGDLNAFYQRAENVPSDSDLVTIFGSFNDLNYVELGFQTFEDALGQYNDNTDATISGCINLTIQKVREIAPMASLVIFAPCPWASTRPFDTNSKLYVDMLEKICEYNCVPFVNLWYYSNMRPWDSSFRILAYSKDLNGNNEIQGVHPNEIGHEILSRAFCGAINNYL